MYYEEQIELLAPSKRKQLNTIFCSSPASIYVLNDFVWISFDWLVSRLITNTIRLVTVEFVSIWATEMKTILKDYFIIHTMIQIQSCQPISDTSNRLTASQFFYLHWFSQTVSICMENVARITESTHFQVISISNYFAEIFWT